MATTGDRVGSTPGRLVIFTRVEGLLRDGAGSQCEIPREALNAILTGDVPLVLVSDADAEDVRLLQRELDLQQPFICDGGAALHIPPRYFSEVAVGAPELEWEVFSFATAGAAAAIRLLTALFDSDGRANILTVGLGCGDRDCSLLAAVDIPIVVRDGRSDPGALLRYVPGAYLTRAAGPAGWVEAIVGPVGH
jgi:predicted mannosyl-3-phosphoglycerate phosphatase (HAD superfamily)